MERPLHGGQTEGVVRVGDTVRRPVGSNVAEIHETLRFLERNGASWVPRVLGVDDQGREILRWAPGEPTWTRHRHYWGALADMSRIGRTVRELHDLLGRHPTSDFDRQLTHGDLGPWNVIAAQDAQLTIIDWDSLGLRPRLWEVAHAAWAFVPLMDRNETDAIGWEGDPPDHAARLLAFCRGYGLSLREVSALLEAVEHVCVKTDAGDAAMAINRAFVAERTASWRHTLSAELN